MHRRINVTLPDDTVRLIDDMAKKGERSQFIDEAIRRHVEALRRDRLRQQVKEGAIARAERDRQLAEEWFPIEEEAWRAPEG